jgi:hypothetical protein
MMNSAVCLEVVSADIYLTTFMKWYPHLMKINKGVFINDEVISIKSPHHVFSFNLNI